MYNSKSLLKQMTFDEFSEANDVLAEIMEHGDVDYARAAGALFRYAYRKGIRDQKEVEKKYREERRQFYEAKKAAEALEAEMLTLMNGGNTDERAGENNSHDGGEDIHTGTSQCLCAGTPDQGEGEA